MNVGDKVWYVPTNIRGEEYAEGKHIEITRKGRVYAYAKEQWLEHKIKIDTGVVYDARNESTGRIYLSQEKHTLERLRKAEWKKVNQYVSRQWDAPEDITLAEVLQVQVLLKMRKAEIAPRAPVGERVYGGVLDKDRQFFHD